MSYIRVDQETRDDILEYFPTVLGKRKKSLFIVDSLY